MQYLARDKHTDASTVKLSKHSKLESTEALHAQVPSIELIRQIDSSSLTTNKDFVRPCLVGVEL